MGFSLKYQKEFASTYLIITTFIVTLKQNAVDMSATNITTYISINQSQNVTFLGFIMFVFLYYVIILFLEQSLEEKSQEKNQKVQSKKEESREEKIKKIIPFLSKTISIFFITILYYSLAEPIIRGYLITNSKFLALIAAILLLILLIIVSIISSMTLENNYSYNLKSTILLIIVAIIQLGWIMASNFLNDLGLLIIWLIIVVILGISAFVYFSFLAIQNWRNPSKPKTQS